MLDHAFLLLKQPQNLKNLPRCDGRSAGSQLRAEPAEPAGLNGLEQIKNEIVCRIDRGLSRRKAMNNWSAEKSVCLLLAAILFNSTRILFAGPDPLATDEKDYSKETAPLVEKSWCETPPPWEIRIGVPGWFAGLSGDVGVKGVVSDIGVSFAQLFRHLTHVPIALSADIRYHRWEFFGDGQYLEVGDSASLPGLLFTNANAHVKYGLAEAFLGYRLINCDKATLSLFAGARYSYLEGDLSIFNNGDARLVRLRELLGIRNKLDFSGSTDWVDPVIGARGKVKIWKAISLYAEGD